MVTARIADPTFMQDGSEIRIKVFDDGFSFLLEGDGELFYLSWRLFLPLLHPTSFSLFVLVRRYAIR